MILKFLQLNIERGRFLDKVITYVKENDFDILQFQEVTGGKFSTYNGADCFQTITSRLGYHGELTVNITFANDPLSYDANATFFKKDIKLLKKKIITLKKPEVFHDISDFNPVECPRSALSLVFDFGGKTVECINTHLAWGPDSHDENYKLQQAKILYEHLKKIQTPFILSGDFNVTPDSEIVQWFCSIGRNLTAENGVTNTLNPKLHKAQELFPKGLAVDYIFAEKSIKINKFKLIDSPDLSDHFGLSIEIEV